MNHQGVLFPDLPEFPIPDASFKGLKSPVWTENKAKLIAKYLYYFVMITRHGAYIDGFAGPKQPKIADSWAAKLVMQSKPRLLRDFFLCDVKQSKIDRLRQLTAAEPSVKGRKIHIIKGDFNTTVHEVLNSGLITPKKATFCLIDQFTMECHWATIKSIAAHKTTTKIELFYFLASGWLDRTIKATSKNLEVPQLWWGRDDWRSLQGIKSQDRALLVCERFKKEFGYKYVAPWPIFDRDGRVMFHMIHASDHPEAPKLMYRAYNNANRTKDTVFQLNLPYSEVESIVKAYEIDRKK